MAMKNRGRQNDKRKDKGNERDGKFSNLKNNVIINFLLIMAEYMFSIIIIIVWYRSNDSKSDGGGVLSKRFLCLQTS